MIIFFQYIKINNIIENYSIFKGGGINWRLDNSFWN
jgi:hypothetical protein